MRTCECFASQQLCTQWWKCLDQLLHLVVAKWYFPSKIFSWHSSIKKRFPCTLLHPFFFENPYELGFFFIHWLHLILFDIQILLDLASGSPFTYQFYSVSWLICPFDISQSFWVSEPIGEKYGLSWLGYCSIHGAGKGIPQATQGLWEKAGYLKKKKMRLLLWRWKGKRWWV